jgi:hypothetical protein
MYSTTSHNDDIDNHIPHFLFALTNINDFFKGSSLVSRILFTEILFAIMMPPTIKPAMITVVQRIILQDLILLSINYSLFSILKNDLLFEKL